MSNLTAFHSRKAGQGQRQIKGIKRSDAKVFYFRVGRGCLCVYVYVHVYVYLHCFCLKALESCLNNTVSSAKIPEGRGELTAYSCYFPRGICEFWEQNKKLRKACFVTGPLLEDKPTSSVLAVLLCWTKLKIREAKTQWDTLGAKPCWRVLNTLAEYLKLYRVKGRKAPQKPLKSRKSFLLSCLRRWAL